MEIHFILKVKKNLILLTAATCDIYRVVVVILFQTEYKQWRTQHMGNIMTTGKP